MRLNCDQVFERGFFGPKIGSRRVFVRMTKLRWQVLERYLLELSFLLPSCQLQIFLKPHEESFCPLLPKDMASERPSSFTD